MAFSQRSWITTASCFKSSNVRSNKDRENNSTIPISEETLQHGKSSFFRKLTSNCLKSPNKVDYATPLNMSSQIFLSRAGCSPRPCRSEEKGRPNSSKTHSSIELPSLGVSGKINEINSYLTQYKGDKINHQVYLKDKSKHRVKDVIRDAKAYPKGSDPNLASLKSESNLCRAFNGFYPRRSLPQDQTIKRSPKNAFSRDAEVKFSSAEKSVGAKPIEPPKRSPVNAEQVLKPVFCDAVAEAIRSDDAKSTVLVDCRTFVIYNNNHIIGALNISCSDCITRKRLLCGRIQVVDLVSGTEDAKLRFKESLENENIKLVLYDEDTKDASSLPKTHPLKVISTSISKVKKRICYLKGGIKEFHRLYSSLCIQLTISPQFQSIIYSPTTQIVEENIDAATMSQVLPFLYVGNERDSVNCELLKNCGITHVINVTSHLPMPLPDIVYKRLPASDSSCQNLKQYFSDAIDFIDGARRRDGKVLVHCQAGVSRSATVAMAYVMSRLSISMMEAFKMIKKCRPIIAPNFNFLGQLLELEAKLGISDPNSAKLGSSEELEDRMKNLLILNGIED